MSYIFTYTGKKFYPLQPKLEDIDIVDIAHALSLICRFNGHCSKFYSVAEHCCHICDLISEENKLMALMHDGSEAYICDICRPIKPLLNNYEKIEFDLQNIIAQRYEYKFPFTEELINYDNSILSIEFRDLFGNTSFPNTMNIDLKLKNWGPLEAEKEFLKRFHKYAKRKS